MSERPEEAIYVIKFVHQTRHFPPTEMEFPDACGEVLAYIGQLEAQVKADAALWEFIREADYALVYNPDGPGFEVVYFFDDPSPLCEVVARDEDPREAVRKAIGHDCT